MQTPTSAQVASFGRHVLTFAMGMVTFAAATHIATGDQAADATTAINQIGTGIASIIAGSTTLIGLASGLYAAWKASPFSQIVSVTKNPEVKQIVVSNPVTADAGGDKVVTKP